MCHNQLHERRCPLAIRPLTQDQHRRVPHAFIPRQPAHWLTALSGVPATPLSNEDFLAARNAETANFPILILQRRKGRLAQGDVTKQRCPVWL